jgi:hypothetical protein
MTAKTLTKTARASAKKVAPLLTIDVACREIEAAADQMTAGIVNVALILRNALGEWKSDAKGKDKENQEKLRAAMQRGVHVRYYILNGHAENRESALHMIAEAKKLAHDSTEPARLTFKKADGVFRVQWLRALEQAGLKTKKPAAPRKPGGETQQTAKTTDKVAGASITEAQEKANAKLANQMTAVLSIGSALEAATFLQGLLQHVENVAAHNAAAFNGEGESKAAQAKLQKICKALHALGSDAAQAIALLKK